MLIKLQTEYHLELLSLTGGCTGSSESILALLGNEIMISTSHHEFHCCLSQLCEDILFLISDDLSSPEPKAQGELF